MFCPSSALVEEESLQIEGPADNSQKALREFTNTLATKYPSLVLSYSQLKECWEFYAGKKE